MSVFLEFVSVRPACAFSTNGGQKALSPLELDLQAGVSHHVCTGN